MFFEPWRFRLPKAFHLVPAVQLFGVLLLLIAVDLHLSPRQNRVPRLAIGASLIIASAIGIILHPNFKIMFHQGKILPSQADFRYYDSPSAQPSGSKRCRRVAVGSAALYVGVLVART